MTATLLAVLAAYGVHLAFTALTFGWTGVAPGPPAVRDGRRRRRLDDWLVHAGLDGRSPAELAGVVVLLAAVGAALAWAVFGGVLAPIAGAAFAATFPVAGARARRERRRQEGREAWPRLIEEIRIKTATLGRSIPLALLDVGAHAPPAMRPAFDAARREWLLSTDFERTVAVLTAGLADATADTVGETLLVAHAIGGSEVDRCLTALVDDRIRDVQGRKDAVARQAGARFARRFVLVVPLGMAMIGLSVGEGRAAYGTSPGQALVLVGLAVIAGCWWWAGAIMRLPDEQRVFDRGTARP
jgi:tight adherence protein B